MIVRQPPNREQRRANGNYTTVVDEEALALSYVQSKIDECMERGISFNESMLSTDEFSKLIEDSKCQ